MSKVAIELRGISKSFGSVVANKNVNLTVYNGEILSLLGENGRGKTTLMNMISGIYFPDEGQIFIDGNEVIISSPKDSFKYGIGMIHQHFKLVNVFSATENIILGLNNKESVDIEKASEKVKAIVNSDITAEKLQVVLEKGTFDKKVIDEREELIALLS